MNIMSMAIIYSVVWILFVKNEVSITFQIEDYHDMTERKAWIWSLWS